MNQKVKSAPKKKGGTKKEPEVSPVKAILLQLGDQFRRARQDKGMTFEAIAKESGVSTLYISSLEKGKYENMGLEVIYQIARSLDLELMVEVK